MKFLNDPPNKGWVYTYFQEYLYAYYGFKHPDKKSLKLLDRGIV